MTTFLCHPDPKHFASCHSEGEKRVLNEVKELKLLRFTQDELRISLRAGSVKGKGLCDSSWSSH